MKPILLSSVNAKWIHPSLALRLLKANLGTLENSAEILEFNLRQPFAEKIQAILARRPVILALSVSIWNHRETLELLAALDERRNRPVVILGGPEVSGLGEDAELFRRADHVIRGEGEIAFRELCRTLMEGGEAPKCIDAEPPEIGGLVSAYGLYTDEDLAGKLTYVEASRGCPFACEFCLSSAGDKTVREFPLDRFLADMDTLISRGARTFKFLDRSFNVNTDRALRIMEFFLERLAALSPRAGRTAHAERPPFTLHFEMIPSRFPQELRETLKRFPPGSLRLEIGIQTLDRKTAAIVSRHGDPGEGLEILEFLRRETSAIVHADLIAGLPGEDLAGFGRGFDKLWKAVSEKPAGTDAPADVPVEIQPGILKLLPGAAIARHSASFGMRYAPQPPYEVTETAALSGEDLRRLKNFARFWELVMNRNVTPGLFPGGAPVFGRFMELSDRLLERFGRNWGIDKKELIDAVRQAEPAS
jgi:radical SAM superfamily enzyme YgiQ (UPF0313 family)